MRAGVGGPFADQVRLPTPLLRRWAPVAGAAMMGRRQARRALRHRADDEPVVAGELLDYWSCFDCSSSLDSGAFFGTPATVSVSSSPGFWACSSAWSGRSCVDSLKAISSVVSTGPY